MTDRNVERRPGFEHVCVIEGLIVDIAPEVFEQQLGELLGVRVQFLETIVTLPTRNARGKPVPDTGGRHDLLFAYHRDDYSSEFNAKRMARQIRWFEDAISPRNNPRGLIYPERVRAYVSAPVLKLLDATAAPTLPLHTFLASFDIEDELNFRDLGEDPELSVNLVCEPGRWHAWVRRDGDTPVALLFAHSAHVERVHDDVDGFFGFYAATWASIARRTDKALKSGDWKSAMRGLSAEHDPIQAAALRDEPEFCSRWGRGPQTVLVGAEAEAPEDLAAGAGVNGEGFWAQSGRDGWSVVGVENEDARALVARVNLSNDDAHNYLIDRKTVEARAELAALPAPAANASVKTYSASTRFEEGDVIRHPTFGDGRVVEVMPNNKVRALFEVGAKVLVHGRGK